MFTAMLNILQQYIKVEGKEAVSNKKQRTARKKKR